MELYLQFSMSEKTEKERCGAFLYLIGQSGRDVYNTMTITDAEKDKLDVLFAKFEEYCNSQVELWSGINSIRATKERRRRSTNMLLY